MAPDQVRERIKIAVKGLMENGEEEAETFVLLGEEGRFDSLTAIQLALAIEREFGIVVEDDEIGPENFGTMDFLERYVRRKSK